MINAVSDRIRNIVKTQQQPHAHVLNLSKSRKKNIQSNTNRSERSDSRTNHSKNKEKPLLRNLTKFNNTLTEQSKTNEKSSKGADPLSLYSEEELTERIKQNIIEIIFPLISEVNKKIDIITESQNIVNQLIKEMQDNFKSISKICVQTQQMSKSVMLQYQSYQDYEEKGKLVLGQMELEILRLKEEQLSITKQLDRMNGNGQKISRSTANLLANNSNSNREDSIQKYFSRTPSTTDISTLPQYKCKCQKLIQQILKSQSHLMMELKYLKHFQNISNKIGHR